MKNNEKKLGILIFILLVGIFLRLWKISEIPLPWVDEITHGSLAFDIIDYGIIKNIFFPQITLGAHGGTTILYFLVPFIFLFGLNLLSVRLPLVILGVLSVALTYYFFKNFYGEKVALLTSFLLTTFPPHIYLSRAVFPYVIATFLGMLSIIFLHEFLNTKNRIYLFLFSLVSGIGITIRLTLIFFLVVIIFLSIKFFKWKFKVKWYDLLISSIIFLLSIYPLIASNMGEFTIFLLLKNFPRTSEGIDLTDISGNLLRGFSKTFLQFMRGQMFYLRAFNSFLFLVLFLFSLTILLIKFILKSKFGYEQFKEDKFSLGVIFFTSILLSTLTITTFREGDYLLLSPFLMVIIARGLIEAMEYLKRYVRYAFYLITVVLTFFIFYEITNFFLYFYSLPQIEEITPESYLFDYICITSTKSLTESIIKLNYSRIFVDESNVLPLTLRWYSQGKISRENIDFMLVYTGDEKTAIEKMIKKIVDGIEDINTVYILTSEDCLRFGPYHFFYRKISPKTIFLDVTKNYNKSVILENKILSPSGYVTHEIYRIV